MTAGAEDLERVEEIEGQVKTLYGAIALLMCFTTVLVGDKAARLLAILLYVLFMGMMVRSFVDLEAIGKFATDPAVLFGLQGIGLILPGVYCGLKRWYGSNWCGGQGEELSFTRRFQTQPQPRSVEDCKRALIKTASPARKAFQGSRSFDDLKTADVTWSQLPDVVMGEVLKSLKGKSMGTIRLVCADWCGAVTRSVSSLTPKEFHPHMIVQSFPMLQSLDLSDCIEGVDAEGISFLQLLKHLRELNLGRHHRMIASSITDDCIVQLKSLSRLHTINLSQCVHVTDEGLAMLATNHPALTSINISGCIAITERGIAKLAHLNNLQHLEIPWCLKVTDAAMNSLAKVPKIKTLNLSGCQLVHEQGISSLAALIHLETLNLLNTGYSKPCVTDAVLHELSSLVNLTNLSIGGMQLQNTHVTDNAMMMISAHHPKLRSLCLMWLDVSDAGVISLLSLTELRSLSLRGCSRVTQASLSHIAKLPYLEDLNLLNMPMMDITDEAVEDLMPLNDLSSLALGDMHMGNLLTDNGMSNLSNFKKLGNLSLAFFQWQFAGSGMAPLLKLDNLKSVDLQGSTSVNNSTLAVIGMLKGVNSLQLSRCIRITSQGMKHMLQLSELQSLSLSHCHRIDDQALEYLGKVDSLQTLVLSGCPALTDRGLSHLSGLIKLKTLDVSGCEGITGIGFEGLERVPLCTLGLSGCTGLVDEGLKAVGKLVGLTKLDMCHCTNVTDVGVARGLKDLHLLTGLDVSSCHKIGDISLGVLSHLPRLTTFRLGGCMATTDHGVAELVKLTALLTVHLDRCINLTDQAIASLGKCTKLTSLRLGKCPYITNNGIAYLSSLSRLSILSLAQCPNITEAGLYPLGMLSSLVSLEV